MTQLWHAASSTSGGAQILPFLHPSFLPSFLVCVQSLDHVQAQSRYMFVFHVVLCFSASPNWNSLAGVGRVAVGRDGCVVLSEHLGPASQDQLLCRMVLLDSSLCAVTILSLTRSSEQIKF